MNPPAEAADSPERQAPSHGLARFLIASGVGLLVFVIAIVTAWFEIAPIRNVRYDQLLTQLSLQHVEDAIAEHHKRTGSPPMDLNMLRAADNAIILSLRPDGLALDGWGNPFAYSVEGDNYVLRSYGRDGKPGGVGLDYDLSASPLLPNEAIPTFSQFLFCMPTAGITVTCGLAGLISFLVCFREVKPTGFSPREVLMMLLTILLTAVTALIAAAFISMLHIPWGH